LQFPKLYQVTNTANWGNILQQRVLSVKL